MLKGIDCVQVIDLLKKRLLWLLSQLSESSKTFGKFNRIGCSDFFYSTRFVCFATLWVNRNSNTLSHWKWWPSSIAHSSIPIQPLPIIPEGTGCKLQSGVWLPRSWKKVWRGHQQNDIVGVADALADIQYVLSWAILEFGLGWSIQESLWRSKALKYE